MEAVEQRTRELSREAYLSSLEEVDRDHVIGLSDSLHDYLLARKIESALIAVGSTVIGIPHRKKTGWVKPNDIDVKVIARYDDFDKFVNGLQGYARALREHLPFRARLKSDELLRMQARGSYFALEEDQRMSYKNFSYDSGFVIKPEEGRDLDIIAKNPRLLNAHAHILGERQRNNAFVVLYEDK
ncbi:hypothetical protein HZB00_01950 [Candidatus Woesearchaeota archaeon]|nr:hypothetical protein [Candidatus Woesearchaeota archaeon]